MLNQVSIMGRLTSDPELRHTPSNVAVTTFTLAVNRSYVKKGEERQTDFIDFVAWRNTAEFVCKYFKKGHLMVANGSIQTRTYTDKEGKNRKVFEILAENVFFTEGAKPAGKPAAEEEMTANNEDFAVISDDDDLPF